MKPWTAAEDKFIESLANQRYTNREIVTLFHAKFGKERKAPAIAKRRSTFFDPNASSRDTAFKAPESPVEDIELAVDGEEGYVSVAASASIKSPEALFDKSGLDPEVWEVVDASPVRKWDVPMKVKEDAVVIPCYYVAIKVRKKWQYTSLPNPVVLNYKRPAIIKSKAGSVFQSLHYSDLHLPFHDPKALNILYSVMDDIKPDIVVDHGDTIDCQEISKYPKDPINRVALKEEIQMGAHHFNTVTDLTPNAEHIWCEGNHEERLKRLIWSLAENRQAGEILTLPKVIEALSWPSLLGLDQLGWEMVPYPQHKLLFHKLIVTHGEKVRAQSGQSEKSELEHYSKSGLSGHTHRIGYYGKKTYDGQLAWWGMGCMCAIRTNYVSFPNWQQGFVVVTWSEDRQNFAVERVQIFDGVAYFRGRRYEG